MINAGAVSVYTPRSVMINAVTHTYTELLLLQLIALMLSSINVIVLLSTEQLVSPSSSML